MQLRTIDYVIWIANPCVLGGVLVFLRRRGLANQFPIFYGYVIFQIATDLLLLGIQRFSYAVYYYTYWAAVVLGILFTFALVDELFRVALRDFVAVRNAGSSVFRWGALLLLLAALLAVLGFPHGDARSGISALVLMSDRIARAMLCLMTLLLLLGARYLYIPARSTLFGIALGFFLYMFGKVILDSVTLNHFSYLRVANRINSFVYIGSCLIWMIYAQYGSRLPSAVTLRFGNDGDALTQRRSVLEALNATVEESMRKSIQKPEA